MSAPRAAAQLLRLPTSLGYSFRPLLRGRGRRSAPSLLSCSTHSRERAVGKVTLAVRTAWALSSFHVSGFAGGLIPRPILALHFRQPFLELLDPHFIQRVGAQKPQTVAAAMLLVVFGETLPEPDGGFRVVSAAGHVNQTEMVCL